MQQGLAVKQPSYVALVRELRQALRMAQKMGAVAHGSGSIAFAVYIARGQG